MTKAWSNSDRPLPPDWAKRRKHVLDRDGHRCKLRLPCCSGTATEVDHIINRARGGSDEPGNLQACCESCHKRKTFAERPTMKRPPEEHPGLKR